MSVQKGTAEFSPDNTYRYRLTRQWSNQSWPGILWVMLNPSTADARTPDNTITRCISFSQAWGFKSLTVVNLYALVSTNPAALFRHEDPVGPENDATIALAAREANLIVVAWGVNAPHPERTRTVLDILRTNWTGSGGLDCLGRTKDGHPKHPGRLAASTEREVFYG